MVARRCARHLIAAVGIGVILVAAIGGHGGAQEPQPLEWVSIDKRDYPEVRVTVAVTGELAATELDSGSFEVRQNGTRRAAEATPVSSSELEVALVVDTSGSIAGSPLEAAKAAAVGFLEQMQPGTRVTVIGFDSAVYVAAPMTTDPAVAIAAIEGLEAGGETALYDGIATALGEFAADTQRSIVVLSDGGDTVSSTTLEAVSDSLASAGVAFYGLSLETPDTDPVAMDSLAEAAAGRVINAADPDALAGVYDAVAAQFANQYLLTFEAVGSGGTAEIQVSLRAGELTAELQRVVDLPTAPAESPAEAPATPQVVEAPGNDWALPVGLAAVFVALLVWGLMLFGPRARTRRDVEPAAESQAGARPDAQPGTPSRRLTDLTERATLLVERTLERRGRQRAVTSALEQAGVALRPGEFLTLAATSSFVGFAVGFLLMGPIAGLLLAALVAIGFRSSLSILAQRRRNRFASQLCDALQLLSGSLRAGYGMLQAFDAVAREAESPTQEEFRRVVIENRLGRNVSESLHALATRMGNDDFEWVVQAMDIHREVGGDLTEVLDTVAGTIRQRDQLRRQVKALSAEGRISAWILFILPIGMFGVIKVISPEYMSDLTASTAGWMMLAGGAFLMLMGGLWLKKIVKLEF